MYAKAYEKAYEKPYEKPYEKAYAKPYAKPHEKAYTKYLTICEIGKGSFGKVKLVQNEKKETFAKKMVKLPVNRKDKEYLVYELVLLRFHKCQYIVSMSDCTIQGQYISMYTDYASRGDLRRLIKKRVKLSPQFICRWILQIASALYYLHRCNVIHRDVKAENIFLYQDKNVKLGDLGIVRQGQHNASTYIGTPYYMTPEIEQGVCSPKTDVYALGIVFYELLHGNPPYIGQNMKQLVYAKRTQNVLYRCKPEFQQIIQKMIVKTVHLRIDIKDLLANKTMNQYYKIDIQECPLVSLSAYQHLTKMTWNGIVKILFPQEVPVKLPHVNQPKPGPVKKPVTPKLNFVPKSEIGPSFHKKKHIENQKPLMKLEYNKVFKSNFILG